MRININPALKKHINKYLEQKELNIIVNDMFLSLIYEKNPISKEELVIHMIENHLSEHEAYLDLCCDYWEIDKKDTDVKKMIIPALVESNASDYFNNPYYKNIKLKNQATKGYSLFWDHYNAYEPFAIDEIKINKNNFYLEMCQISYFNEEFPFIALAKDGVTWMSITPNEIKTMQSAINQARGNVLVFGLGLGYYPYMASLKDDVQSITIIEKDTEIINLFKKELLPQFPNKQKIKIINANAFEYKTSQKFESTFVDLWHNPNDGLETYINILQKEQSNYGIYQYWLEDSLIAYFRRFLLLLIDEQMNGSKESDYIKAQTFEDRLMNALYHQTKNLVINNENDLTRLLDVQNIKPLMRQIKI